MNRTGSIVIGTLITTIGLLIVALAASSDGELSRPLLFGALISVAGVVRLMMAFSMDAPARRAPPADRSDPRWDDGVGRVQLAGRACVECGRKITIEAEGVPCLVCAAPAHAGCEDLHRAHAHRPDTLSPFR